MASRLHERAAPFQPLECSKIFLRLNGHLLLHHREMNKNFNLPRTCGHAWGFKEFPGRDKQFSQMVVEPTKL